MISEVAAPFVLAAFWSTVGCLSLRCIRKVAYDFLGVIWLMTVFAFTLLNSAVFLSQLLWPVNIFMSGSGAIAPFIAYFGYRRSVELERETQRWAAPGFGGLLVSLAVVLVLRSDVFYAGFAWTFSELPAVEVLALFLVCCLTIGLSGIAVLLRTRTRQW